MQLYHADEIKSMSKCLSAELSIFRSYALCHMSFPKHVDIKILKHPS